MHVVLLFLLLFGFSDAIPSPYVMNTLTTPPSVKAYDSFGVSVSIKGDAIAVGADVGGPSSQGVVHTFVNYVHESEFLAHDGEDGDRFGNSVVIWDEWLFIGAFLQDRSGKVYVYRHNTTHWGNHSELVPLVRVRDGYFGHRVRAKNYTLAVSHPSAKIEQEEESGNVNIFNNWGLAWVLGNLLTSEEPKPRALHGFSVDFDRGDQMIVGSPKEGNGGVGYIYVYGQNKWNVYDSVNGLPGAELGHAVAIDNGHIAISSRTGGPTGNGYVVTYKNDTEEDTWVLSDQLITGDVTSSGGVGTAFFGNDVIIHGDVMVIGSPFEGATGAIYIYHWWPDGIGWHRHHKIEGPEPGAANDWYHSMFGWSLDMDNVNGNDILIVGSPGAVTLDGTKRAGSVFIFSDIQFTRPPAPTLAPTSSPTTRTPTTSPTTSAPTTGSPTATQIPTTNPTTPQPSLGSKLLTPYMTIAIILVVMNLSK